MKKMTTLLNKIPTLVVESKESAKFSVSQGAATEGTFDIAKSGYEPVGVVGYITNGSGASYLAPYRMRIVGTTAYYGVRHYGTGTLSNMSITMHVLYVKLGGGS